MAHYYKKAIYKQERSRLTAKHDSRRDTEEDDDNKPLSHYIKISDQQKKLQEQWKQQRERIKQYYNNSAVATTTTVAKQQLVPLIDAIPNLRNSRSPSNNHRISYIERRKSAIATTASRPLSAFSPFTPTSIMLLLLDDDSGSRTSSLKDENTDEDDEEDSIPIGLLVHTQNGQQPLSAAEKYKEKVRRVQRLQQEQQHQHAHRSILLF